MKLTTECSGAKDMMIPGEYTEILSVHANDSSPFLREIEKDVTRTFPGNVFFGGFSDRCSLHCLCPLGKERVLVVSISSGTRDIGRR